LKLFYLVYTVVKKTILRFRNDRCGIEARSLSYISLLSLIPILIVTILQLKNFYFRPSVREIMLESISAYFLPETVKEIVTYIEKILKNSRSADALSIGFSILMSLSLVFSLSRTINRIWKKHTQKSVIKCLVKAVIVLLCAPVFLIITLYLQNYVSLRSVSFIIPLPFSLNSVSMQFLSLVVNWFLLAFIFGIMPNYRVKTLYTMIAGIFSGTLWYILRLGLNVYVTVIPQFSILYGSLAFFPILLVWIYISWMIVLFGIQLNYTFHFELE